MGKPVQFIKDVVSNDFTIASGVIGQIVDNPNSTPDGGRDATYVEQEQGVLKIKALADDNKIHEVGIPIDRLSAFVADVPLGTTPTPVV